MTLSASLLPGTHFMQSTLIGIAMISLLDLFFHRSLLGADLADLHPVVFDSSVQGIGPQV